MVDAERPLHDLLKKIARDRGYVDTKIKLKRLDTGGANYSSKLFTTTVSAPGKKDLQLFCKVASTGEEWYKCAKGVTPFEREIMLYSKIIPKYRELEEIHKVPSEDRLIAPQFYGGSTEYMKELLVLEDLSATGYQCRDRFDCVDWKYASRCVSVLARFHALSVAFEKDDPETYSNLVDGLMFEYPVSEDSLEKCIETAVKATDIMYRSRVDNFLRDDLRRQTLQKYVRQERRIFLCHCDFRPSNILHKIDEGGNLRVVLADYQVMRRWNPVADLIYFLVLSSDEQFRADHLHQFFDHYYESLSAALRQLSLEPREVYSEKDYREDIKQVLPSGLVLAIFVLPYITVETDNAPKPDDRIDFETYEVRTGDCFRERFNGLVKTYDKLGIL